MRALLLTSLLILVSCGKNNELQNSKNSSNAVESSKPYFTFNHEEGRSKFRNKLLNAIVAESFPSEQISIELKHNDELDSNELNPKELEDYKSIEQTMAKVVVSFSGHTDIFLMPDGLPVVEIAKRLSIKADPDHGLKFLKSDYVKTTKGQIFYLVSVNHEELMVNDQNFYQKPVTLNEKFTAEKVKLDGSKKFEFTVKYTYFTQQLAMQAFSKPVGGRQSKGCWETDSCINFCNYNMQVPTAEYAKASAHFGELGFAVKINGKIFPLEALKATQASDDSFKFSVVENEASLGESGLQIITLELPASQVTTPGTSCGVNGTADIGHKAEFAVGLTVWGRGEELRKIKL